MAVGGFQKLDGGSIHIRNLIKEQAAQTIPGSADDPLPPGALGVAGVSNENASLCVRMRMRLLCVCVFAHLDGFRRRHLSLQGVTMKAPRLAERPFPAHLHPPECTHLSHLRDRTLPTQPEHVLLHVPRLEIRHLTY